MEKSRGGSRRLYYSPRVVVYGRFEDLTMGFGGPGRDSGGTPQPQQTKLRASGTAPLRPTGTPPRK